jgi:hypothetical protein
MENFPHAKPFSTHALSITTKNLPPFTQTRQGLALPPPSDPAPKAAYFALPALFPSASRQSRTGLSGRHAGRIRENTMRKILCKLGIFVGGTHPVLMSRLNNVPVPCQL